MEETLEKVTEAIRKWTIKDIENTDGPKAISILLAHHEKMEAINAKSKDTKDSDEEAQTTILRIVEEMAEKEKSEKNIDT